MWLIFLYPIFWAIIFYRINDKKGHLMLCAIVLVLLLSALTSCYLVYYDEEYYGKELSFVAIVYHLALMWVYIKPLKYYDRMHSSKLHPIPSGLLQLFTFSIIIIMVLYVANGIQNVNIAALLTDSQELREVLLEEKTYNSIIMRYIDYVGSTYAMIPLALMFYYMSYSPNSKLIIYLLLLCSLGQAILSLEAAGREYILKYVFVFIALYYCVSSNLTKAWKKRATFFFIGIAVSFVALFIIITIARFTYTRDISASSTILSYLGQGNVNFSENFIAFPEGIYPHKGQHTFPLIFGHSNISVYNLNDTISTDVRLNVFATGIGSWLRDCGIYLTAIVTVFFSMLFRLIGRLKSYNVFTLIYFALVFEQVFSLLFFFHGTWNGTRVLFILLLVLLDKISRLSKPNILVLDKSAVR